MFNIFRPRTFSLYLLTSPFFGLCFAHVFFLLLFEIFGLDLIHFKGEEVAWAWWGLRWLRAAGPPARGGPKTGWSPLGRSRRAQQAGSRRFWIQIVSLKLFRIIFCPRCCNFLEYFYFKMMCIKACFFCLFRLFLDLYLFSFWHNFVFKTIFLTIKLICKYFAWNN